MLFIDQYLRIIIIQYAGMHLFVNFAYILSSSTTHFMANNFPSKTTLEDKEKRENTQKKEKHDWRLQSESARLEALKLNDKAETEDF